MSFMGGGGVGVGMTGEGVTRDLKAIRKQIGRHVDKSPGVMSRALDGERNPQFQRSVANGNRWALKLKKHVAETRVTSRPTPNDSSPGVQPRPVNQRRNTGAIDQLYQKSQAIKRRSQDSRAYGVDAGGGPK